jgi:hypothetical protein
VTTLIDAFFPTWSRKERENVEIAWNRLHILHWIEIADAEKFWVEVKMYRDSTPLECLADLALSLLSLPLSNAEAERVFSQMNIVKSKIRNRMQLSTLVNILHVRPSEEQA